MSLSKALVCAALFGAGCRLGGPERDPSREIVVDAGGARVEDAESAEEAAAFADDASPNETALPEDASLPASDASLGDCVGAMELECDPVRSEGCLPLMQCIVDPASDAPATFCVFSSIQLDATCTQDELSTDCPPQHTCVMGECRKYCYCDSDCEGGAACTDPSGEGGSDAFKLCAQAP